MRLIKLLFWFLIALCVAGTAFAISDSENAMSAPFRGMAVKTLEVSSSVLGFFRSSRTVAVTQEYSAVSGALQSMMLNEDVIYLPAVEKPSNNMSEFPSKEFSLYPYYVSLKTTQFSYTIDSKGELLLTQNDVSVDPALTQIYLKIYRLQNTEQSRVLVIR